MKTLRNKRKKTYYLYTAWGDRHKEFFDAFKKELELRGWKEGTAPVDFMFLYFSYQFAPPILDTRQSKLTNLIKGSAFDYITDAEQFITKFKHKYFMYPYQFIDDEIPDVTTPKTLFPVSHKYPISTITDGKYDVLKRSVKSADDIRRYKAEFPQVKRWLLRDNLDNPCLKDGYVFNLNFVILVKLNPLEIYAVRQKQYIKAGELYTSRRYVYDPHAYGTKSVIANKESIPTFFPKDLPDGWTQYEAEYTDKLLENAIPIIFAQQDFQPDANSKNAYFIFNAYVRLFEQSPPLIFYIYNTFSPQFHAHLVPALVSILIDKKEHPDFKRIPLEEQKLLIHSDNFKFKSLFSNHLNSDSSIGNTFYLGVEVKDYPTYSRFYQEKFNHYLVDVGYEEKKIFPVKLVYVIGEFSYYRNRFDTKGSEWINLLYGSSKSIITNKLLLHENFKGAPYLVPSTIVTKTVPEFTGLKILKPFGGFKGDGIFITQSREDAQQWINQSKYTQWLLQDYLVAPELLQNYKFHYRIFVLVVITDIRRVYVSSMYFYRVAKKEYIEGQWDDADIHDTHYNKEFEEFTFPKKLPDDWTEDDIEPVTIQINQLFTEIFKNHYEFKPEWNAKNGFELFGADVIFQDKKPYVLEINTKIGAGADIDYIKEGIVSIILNGEEHSDFVKIL